MFIGHYAPAFVAAALIGASSGSKILGARRPAVLAIMMAAAQLVDIFFFALVIGGAENMRIIEGISASNNMDFYHMPYTHSLLGNAIFALIFAIIIQILYKHRRLSILAGCVVLSHWFIDWLVHIPDLTMMGSAPKFGLGLWNYPMIARLLETTFIGISILFYFAARHKKMARRPFWVLVMVLIMLQSFDWFAPAPTQMSLRLPMMALFAYIVVILLSFWNDRAKHK
ncbi:hypothetical protein LPB140_01380 [Sphingorhabdus lutea]|uniref:Metal-dependent hydrolase n=1 Tax=Sphingorhabdus lutea TaxID=1913578 RepID=A0A1L3J9B6_9SPHN|nr:hypothetical protein [Sphingorhabdus lutea]APG61710.1 hypothetical protein LPB140_01380 [Sphingorhabdus lutea]